jgi:hypothetical protein
VPVTLINDCCLAFSVLLHNDGERYGPESMRVLDLTAGMLTPTIMTQDAHKHLGADKGISMAMYAFSCLQFRLASASLVPPQSLRLTCLRYLAVCITVIHCQGHPRNALLPRRDREGGLSADPR